ncbi:aminodeoxychorismate synthase component I [Salegentibacter sp. F188]|uniref:aminodeoxychorismate synthase n=1 Tax=Autumnicola patrickiae TaxID=3075591 RepID=A0ABU3DWW7_9FLAO|nr:aminodeoxychorismate synthase component I [Salegentibacter sp. F188]MDT0688209.1 aminodeoxychorismate synthase component I [Salegentibacter sp. F188]
MRTTKSYPLDNPEQFKKQLFAWSRQFDEITWLDSNNYQQENSSFDALLAVQAFTALKTDYHQAFDQLQEYQETTKDWIFGYLSYELKNDVERLTSKNYDGLRFPDLYFFQPQKIIQVKGNNAEFHYLRMVDDEMDEDFNEILNRSETHNPQPTIHNPPLKIEARISKEEYLHKVHNMLEHIQRGDIYEANFCQEFYVENCQIQPSAVFSKLNDISGPPFATFLKLEEHYLLCASPERYLKKSGSKILSQPIKGTARRSENKEEDLQISRALANDPKEISENVMIVDLVRNDLSKIAKKGSVHVDELCKVYTFNQVHQLISTISAQFEEGLPAVEALRATFPMGSMTGAPKISAMEIIEELEETKRELYSGAVGYFTPDGDFDFNVVIRSILYNAEDRYLSFSVGGAITAKSDPEKEYEECLLKAKAMREALSS